MKRNFVSLSALFTGIIFSLSAAAQGASTFQIAHAARSGEFSDQGIPGYHSFFFQIAAGQTSTQDVMNAAIAHDMLTSAQADEDFEWALKNAIRNVCK